MHGWAVRGMIELGRWVAPLEGLCAVDYSGALGPTRGFTCKSSDLGDVPKVRFNSTSQHST